MNGASLNNSNDLLRRLQPAVNPAAAGAADIAGGPRSQAAALFESKRFDELLSQASRGEIRSDRPVQATCDLQPPLDVQQLQRLERAADRAEAGGAQRALMMIDGRGLVMDITGRTITAEMKPNETGKLLQIDTAMVVPGRGDGPVAHGSSATSAVLLPTSPSVARLLQSIHGDAIS